MYPSVSLFLFGCKCPPLQKQKKFFCVFWKKRAPRYLKQNTYIFTLDNILRGVKKRTITRFRGYYCYFLTMNWLLFDDELTTKWRWFNYFLTMLTKCWEHENRWKVENFVERLLKSWKSCWKLFKTLNALFIWLLSCWTLARKVLKRFPESVEPMLNDCWKFSINWIKSKKSVELHRKIIYCLQLRHWFNYHDVL